MSSDDLFSNPPNPENGDDFLFPLGPIAEDEENGLLDPEELLEDPRPPLPKGDLLGDLLDEPNGDLPDPPVAPNPLNPLPGDLFDAPIPPLLPKGDLPGDLLEPKGDLPGPLLDEPNADFTPFTPVEVEPKGEDEPKLDC